MEKLLTNFPEDVIIKVVSIIRKIRVETKSSSLKIESDKHINCKLRQLRRKSCPLTFD